MIQFLDSVGANDLASYCTNYFFDKEHEDGFIQNIKGYMLENGASLYSAGLHFEYTKDIKWVERNQDKIEKASLYIIEWMKKNENGKILGFGMIDGQVADPEDTYCSYCLNAIAYAGLDKAWRLLKTVGKDYCKIKQIFYLKLMKYSNLLFYQQIHFLNILINYIFLEIKQLYSLLFLFLLIICMLNQYMIITLTLLYSFHLNS
jgi:hypothetical protein